jgi:hypothetical protein
MTPDQIIERNHRMAAFLHPTRPHKTWMDRHGWKFRTAALVWVLVGMTIAFSQLPHIAAKAQIEFEQASE